MESTVIAMTQTDDVRTPAAFFAAQGVVRVMPPVDALGYEDTSALRTTGIALATRSGFLPGGTPV